MINAGEWEDDLMRAAVIYAPRDIRIPELLADALAGDLDPSPVFDVSVDLAGVPGGYAAMSDRTALKVLVRP